jgi:hypothetical protein
MVMGLFKGVHQSGAQYLADSFQEIECARIGYRTRLSRLHIPDPH